MFDPKSKPGFGWRRTLYEVIFETETTVGYVFDLALLALILASVIVVSLESVPEIREGREATFIAIEWVFTIIFSIEYILRTIAVREQRKYCLSFFGIVDFVSVLPSYLALFLTERAMGYTVIRILRLLRIFRVLKLGNFLREGGSLLAALTASRYRISVFVGAVLALVTIMGALLHVIEGPENGFDSIPKGIYWAIVTLTTVGYGDISPKTALGQAIASVIMVLGYGIIAVPTGIVTVELGRAGTGEDFDGDGEPDPVRERVCMACGMTEHRRDAVFCRRCASRLPENEPARSLERLID